MTAVGTRGRILSFPVIVKKAITGAGRGNGGHNGNLHFIHEFAVKWTGRWTAL